MCTDSYLVVSIQLWAQEQEDEANSIISLRVGLEPRNSNCGLDS